MVVYIIKSIYIDEFEKTSSNLFGESTEEEAVKTCERLRKESEKRYKDCPFKFEYSYEAIYVY